MEEEGFVIVSAIFFLKHFEELKAAYE